MTTATAPFATRLAAPRAPYRLRRRAYKLALVGHVLTSVGWFGIAAVVAFCGLAAAGTGDASFATALYRVMHVAPWLSVPTGLLAIATGAVLSLGTAHGLVRHWWVVAKIVIAVAVVLTDAFLLNWVAADAVATGDPAPPLYGVTIAHVVLLAVATVLSVFKPRARTPWADRAL